MIKYTILPILALALTANEAIQYTQSTNGLSHPFFGYKKVIEKEDENKTKKSVSIPKDLDKLSADEINKIIKESKKIAVSFPTVQNIQKYIKLQNYAMKKSEKFMTKWQQALLKDSSLDLSAPIAKGTFARNAATFQAASKREQFWKDNIDKIGIVVFFNTNETSINKAQNRVLYFIKKDYQNMAITTLFKQEHKNLSSKHGVKVTPDIFIVYKDEEDAAQWYRVKTGLTTKDKILDQIDFVYKYLIAPGIKK